VSEFDLRQTLQEKEETIPNQLKKQTSKPSMQWVYFLFRVVNELTIQQGEITQKIVVNLNPLLKRIILYFGIHAQRIYLNPG
jgi:transposase